jgi:putative transposase
MPRTALPSAASLCYLGMNLGNNRATVLHKDGDCEAFVLLLAEAKLRHPMRILAYCQMPNHSHLALWPLGDGTLGRWMHWLLTAHVRRYQRNYHGSGHVWQWRFKAFPIREDGHLLTVLRCIERNPLRGRLVERAEHWRWSSLEGIAAVRPAPWLDLGPVPRGADWVEAVNAPMFEPVVEAIRGCVRRDRPFGGEVWVSRTAAALGLASSLRATGNPAPKAVAQNIG